MILHIRLACMTCVIALCVMAGAHAQAPQAASQPSEAALSGYYALYRNPFVLGLRSELDGYLALKRGKASKWHGQRDGRADAGI